MRGRKYLCSKNNELNIKIEENPYRHGSTPLDSSRNLISHRQKALPVQNFSKNNMDKENTHCFSNIPHLKKKAFDQSEFNSNLNKEDNYYIKNLRGILRKDLFLQQSNYGQINNQPPDKSFNESNIKGISHSENYYEDEKHLISINFKENFLFDLKHFKKIIGFLDFLDVLNFQYVCKKSLSAEFKSLIKRLVCEKILKVFLNFEY